MFSVQSNARQWERAFKGQLDDLRKCSARTLTRLAQQANTLQKRNLQDGRITLRAPKFAINSCRVFKAGESRPIDRQDSVVGTVSNYLPVVDQGGKVKPKGKNRLVPTFESRGLDDSRPVLRGFRLPKILPITRRGRKGGRPGGAFVIVSRTGKPAVYIRQGKRAKLVKVRHLAAGPSVIRPYKWHQDAVNKVWNEQNLARIFRQCANELLGR